MMLSEWIDKLSALYNRHGDFNVDKKLFDEIESRQFQTKFVEYNISGGITDGDLTK